jgi:site-specific DNA recombinase
MGAEKHIGIWIRVSTDRQVKDESPEHHEKRARLYAEAKGWHVAEVYHLDAVSGKSVMDQPETKRMLKDIRSGHITGLIFSKLARLARNTKELLEFAELFRNANADLISLAESIDTSTPAGRLFYTMIAAMATWEREEIADRVAASVPIRAKLGKPLGGAASFGYRWEGKELLVDDKEAPVRRLLYDLFLKYKRKKTVASELNNLGHRTRNGSKFSDTTVGRLLKDPTAKGQRIANYTKSLGEGKNWVVKPKDEWVVIPCDPIVSEDVWDECNDILSTANKKRKKRGPRSQHLLAGYVVCACGKNMYVFHENTKTYRCKGCNNKIVETDLDEIYHQQLQSFLLTDTDMDEYRLRSDDILKGKEELLKTNRSDYDRLGKRMSELVTLRLDGELSKELFPKEYKPLEERYLQIGQQIPELEAEIDFLRINYYSSETVLEEAKNLYERWPALPFEERRSIVEIITDKVTIGKTDIHIELSYNPTPLPHPSFPKRRKKATQFQGFIEAINIKLAGKSMAIFALEIVTLLSSIGWRITSRTALLNSGNSSRKRTPLCASEISPGCG